MLWKEKDWEDGCRNKRIGVNIANMEDEKMNQERFAERMWKALLRELYEEKIVSTFKGREAFQVVSFSDERIVVRLTSKDKEVFLSKTAMMNAIRKLIAYEDGVRQKMVDPESRLKLGLLSLLPWTEKIKRLEDGKNISYLLLTAEAREQLAVGE
jgi:hypothetical protein